MECVRLAVLVHADTRKLGRIRPGDAEPEL
jgi:hypothetical protein